MIDIEKLKVGDKLFCIKTYSTYGVPSHGRGGEFEDFDEFIIGKLYTIKSKLISELILKGERNTIYINSERNDFWSKDLYFLNTHFCTILEARKIKLQELSDINFSNFLKKVKN